MTRRYRIAWTGLVLDVNEYSSPLHVTEYQLKLLVGNADRRNLHTIDVSNEPKRGWMSLQFRKWDSTPSFYAVTGEYPNRVAWCIRGLRRAGIRFRDGGKLWWKVVTP